jgi:hypothetical protein
MQSGRNGEQKNISGPLGSRIQSVAGNYTHWSIPLPPNTGT